MKRIRNEQISSIMTHYLKRRQYLDPSDIPQKRELKHNVNKQELAVDLCAIARSSIGNYMAYSSVSGDTTACDQQYSRIKAFIGEAVEPYRAELRPLLYPLFVHIYLELLCNGQKTPAHKFYTRHHSPFLGCEESVTILDRLKRMYSKEDVVGDALVMEFREHKYRVTMSDETLDYLLRYLKSDENVLLLQIFNQHISVQASLAASLPLLEEDDDGDPEEAPPSETAAPDDSKAAEVTASSLQKCMDTIRNGRPCLPSVCLYSVQNAHQGMCGAAVASDRSVLCGGFEDSVIRMWSLTPERIRSEVPAVCVSNLHLALDYEDDVTEKRRLSVELKSDKEMICLRGHSASVYDVSFTCDDKFILSASADTTVRIWERTTNTHRAVYQGHNYPIWGVEASPVGGYFATCSHDRTAKVWATDRTFPLRSFLGHTADVDCVKFHPNGSYLATGSSDRSVRLWSVHEGKSVRLFHGHKAAILALAFSPDGRMLASAGEDKRVKVWDLSSGSLLRDFKGHTEVIHSLTFNGESTVLASGGLDGAVKIWDVHTPSTISDPSTPGESHSSPELLRSLGSKGTTLHHLQYTTCDLLLAVGASAL